MIIFICCSCVYPPVMWQRSVGSVEKPKCSDIILVTEQRCSVQEFSGKLHIQCSGMILALGQLIKARNKKSITEQSHLSSISVRSSRPCFGTSRLVSRRASFRLRTSESIPNIHKHTYTCQRNTWLSFAHDRADRTLPCPTFVLSSSVPKLWECFDWCLIHQRLQRLPALKWVICS